jgi:hypothetical protein
MLGALGGITIVALVLLRDRFRLPVFVMWLMAALTMWFHEHGVVYL